MKSILTGDYINSISTIILPAPKERQAIASGGRVATEDKSKIVIASATAPSRSRFGKTPSWKFYEGEARQVRHLILPFYKRSFLTVNAKY